VTDNTTITIPSTATVGGEGQRQEGSTLKKTTTSDNNNNNTLPLLPSWNEDDTKEKILNFVKNEMDPQNSDYYIYL
jgi:hypothetical protein